MEFQLKILCKTYMKSRYRGGKHHHIFILMDKAKTGRDSVTEYYCTEIDTEIDRNKG